MEKSPRSRDKSQRQQQVQMADSNANSTATREDYNDLITHESNDNNSCFDNYMKLNFYDPMQAGTTEYSSTQFTQLYCDFPVSYETTEIITAAQFANLVTKPRPPTPPPISRLQQLTAANISVSAPATPSRSRGKVVLSKKERKELNKLHKLLDRSETTSSSAIGDIESGELLNSHSESNTYRGRVSELRNCIAKINSKVLFGSLNRSFHKSLPVNNAINQEEFTPSNEATLPQPTDISPPNLLTFNNNDANYSEKLKNLPVRQRKTHASHMENYCLFDPVDFINDKALRKRTQITAMQQVQSLRDPLFSSRQSLSFPDEDPVPEIIYDNKESSAAERSKESSKFEHHNYFVIDPDDFEKEPTFDILLPNKNTNEKFLNAKYELGSNVQDGEDIIQVSTSYEYSLNKEQEQSSQESKDIEMSTEKNETGAPAGLVESSSSAASALTSSSTSATSSQTTLQHTKKKLTFLSLSPFRAQSPKNLNNNNNNNINHNNNNNDNDNKITQDKVSENKAVERAVSELVSSEHMLHLQQMLLNSKENMRSRTVPIEANYVLFNPGPVPSRNVPYKVRKPRPLSTNSDADSGFLSPCSPDESSSLKSNPAILVLQQCDSIQGYLEVR